MTTMNADELRKLGEKLDEARKELWQVFDDLGADYASDAAKQFELRLQNEDDPDRTYDSWWVKNDRENIWFPTIGGKLPNDGEKWPWVITSFEESVQPQVRQAKVLLDKTRDVTETMLTMTNEDMKALSNIPDALAQSNGILTSASKFMEEAANKTGEIRNELNSSSWQGDGRDAYFGSLTPQEDAFKECQTYIEDTMEANTALAGITADVVGAFFGVRTKQVQHLQTFGDVIFLMVNPVGWLDIAEKMFNSINRVQTTHTQEFEQKLDALSQSAEKSRIIEEAERTVGMTWPAPLSGMDGTWAGGA